MFAVKSLIALPGHSCNVVQSDDRLFMQFFLITQKKGGGGGIHG